MTRTPLSLDTPAEIERQQIAGWRQLSSSHVAELVTSLTKAALTMALAGIRDRYPGETDRQHLRRLAVLLHGEATAAAMFPDILAGR